MKISDFIIIYLACGAPFGVFYFLQHRRGKFSFLLYLKSIGLFFVWIPYASRLLHGFVTSRFQRFGSKVSAAEKLKNIEKQFSRLIFESDSNVSLYNFREVFDRYTGLTMAKNSAEKVPPKASEEIFRVALRQNTKLGAQCLHRRNLKRIELHQTCARQDFVNLVSQFDNPISGTKQLKDLVFELSRILNDEKVFDDLCEIFALDLQQEITQTEEVFWTSKERKKPSPDGISLRLRALTTLRKD